MSKMDFYLKSVKNNYSATLSYEDGQYILRAGSTVSKSVSTHFKSHATVELRRKEHGISLNNSILKQDIVFKSSTVAGEFVCGSSCNGPSCWKNSDGLTIKEWMGNNDGTKNK